VFEALVGRQLDAHVAVVGAGPAGSATAALLARAGLDVMLLDRDAFPRDKVCGDFVSPTALVELEWLGIGSRPEFHAANAISSASLHIDGERLVEQGLPETPGLPSMGRVVPRAVLDEWIVDAARTAGARVMEKAAVKGIEIDERGVELELAGRPSRVVRAGLVVGADGSNSLVARQLRGHGPDRADRIVAVRAYYDGVEGDDHEAALYFSERTFPGYTWLFPTGAGTANVGVGMMLATIPAGDHHLRDLLEDVVRSDHALGPRLRSATRVGRILGWPLTTYNPRLPLVGDRMLLVGDAAGLINPLNGEGIQYALASARWAAETIAACAAGPRRFDTDGLLPYAQRVEEQLGTDMTLARAIVQLISNRALNPFWLLALRAIADHGFRAARRRSRPAQAAIRTMQPPPAEFSWEPSGPSGQELLTSSPRRWLKRSASSCAESFSRTSASEASSSSDAPESTLPLRRRRHHGKWPGGEPNRRPGLES